MYTVARFISENEDVERLEEIGKRLNEIHPNTFTGLGRHGCQFAIDISKADDWMSHHEAISAFLKDRAEIIRFAKQLSIFLIFDVAVEPEDIAGHPCIKVGITPSLGLQLYEMEAELHFSIYNGTDNWWPQSEGESHEAGTNGEE